MKSYKHIVNRKSRPGNRRLINVSKKEGKKRRVSEKERKKKRKRETEKEETRKVERGAWLTRLKVARAHAGGKEKWRDEGYITRCVSPSDAARRRGKRLQAKERQNSALHLGVYIYLAISLFYFSFFSPFSFVSLRFYYSVLHHHA